MYSTETLTRAIRDIAVRVDENRAVAAEQPRHERSRQQQRGPRGSPLRTSVFRRRAPSAAANDAAAARAAAAAAGMPDTSGAGAGPWWPGGPRLQGWFG